MFCTSPQSGSPCVHKASCSQTLLKHTNRPFLLGLAHLVRASIERRTTREIEICGHG